MRLITVVMGEPSTAKRSNETSRLLDYGFNTYSIKKIIENNKSIGKVVVEKGKSEEVDIITVKDISILEKKGEKKRNIDYDIKLNIVKAPVKKGDVIGKVQVFEKNKIIEEVDITVKKDIKRANIINLYLRNLKDVISGNIKF